MLTTGAKALWAIWVHIDEPKDGMEGSDCLYTIVDHSIWRGLQYNFQAVSEA